MVKTFVSQIRTIATVGWGGGTPKGRKQGFLAVEEYFVGKFC